MRHARAVPVDAAGEPQLLWPAVRRVSLVPPQVLLFIAEYLVDLDARSAATRAGYASPGMGRTLLQRPAVRALVAEGMEARAIRVGITADAVIARLWRIATADAREVVQHVRGCCRYCHGAGHDYQRTEAERATAYRAWAVLPAAARAGGFAEFGGVGYDAQRAPAPQCPECGGRGVGSVVVADTRALSGDAVALYKGTKQTGKGGVEVQLHDQAAALELVGRHLGLFRDRVEVDVRAVQYVVAVPPRYGGPDWEAVYGDRSASQALMAAGDVAVVSPIAGAAVSPPVKRRIEPPLSSER